MAEWVSVKVAMPNNEIACVALRRNMDKVLVYPKFVEWDGDDWIDIDGEAVPGVIAWTKAPEYNTKIEEVLSKLAGCVGNDKCEEKDCCYWVAADLIQTLLLEYSRRELGGC